MTERIKKTPDGNQYFLTKEGMWVRNLTLEQIPYIDLNKTIENKDTFMFLQNETKNNLEKYTWIDSEKFSFNNVVIVSDGYDFIKKQNILSKLPKDTTIIGVNGSLAKWNISERSLNWYVVNNPFDECIRYLPRRGRVLPKCIASCRTNHKFLSAYRGSKSRYYPVNEKNYTSIGLKDVHWQVDDYRNPICAAISLAYQFGAEKILLFCCDDSFKTERQNSINLKNGLYEYPQQSIAHGIIDGLFYWLKNHPYYKTILCDHSSSQEYKHATYISEEDILPFFQQGGEKYE
jgi:hypothetical protein